MLRTAQLLPPPWLLTLGFDPTRFQTEPPACYRASWQLPGPDFTGRRRRASHQVMTLDHHLLITGRTNCSTNPERRVSGSVAD